MIRRRRSLQNLFGATYECSKTPSFRGGLAHTCGCSSRTLASFVVFRLQTMKLVRFVLLLYMLLKFIFRVSSISFSCGHNIFPFYCVSFAQVFDEIEQWDGVHWAKKRHRSSRHNYRFFSLSFNVCSLCSNNECVLGLQLFDCKCMLPWWKRARLAFFINYRSSKNWGNIGNKHFERSIILWL